ncbi:hypothetical protein SAI_0614, partial [Streptococcus agalactiae H36B]
NGLSILFIDDIDFVKKEITNKIIEVNGQQ